MFQVFKVKNILAPKKTQLLLGIFCWVMYEFVFGWLLLLFFDIDTKSGAYWYQISYFCTSFLMTAGCFFPFLKESLSCTDLRQVPLLALKGYGFYYLMALVLSYLFLFLRFVSEDASTNINQDVIDALLKQNPLPLILSACLIVPVTEECLVRGMIFAPLCRKSPLLAYVVSALVFSVMHMIASIGEMTWLDAVENLLTYVPSSIALGWVYQYSGTIIAPIALHCLTNLIAFLLNLAM